MNGKYQEVRKAMIIAISDYEHLDPLLYCRNDGVDMHNRLKNLGFQVSDKKGLIGDVRYFDMHDKIIDFFTHAKNDDLLLFYFSGHGMLGDRGRHYLSSSETDLITRPILSDR